MKIVFSVSVPEVALYFLKEQAAYFKARQFQVHIVTGNGTWTKDSDVRRAFDVMVHTFEITRVFSVFTDLRTLIKLILFFRKLSPDYLYATTPKAALLTIVAGTIANVPRRVYLIRGLTYVNDNILKKSIMQFLEWFTCLLSHKVLIVSKSNLDYVVRHHLCYRGKIKVLANGSSHGVDAQGHFDPHGKSNESKDLLRKSLSIPHKSIVIGFLGRMVKDKGVEILIEAWRQISTRHPTAHLLLIGPQDVPRDSLSKQSYEYMRATPNVHLIGDVRDPADFYGIMDIFVLPSLREGFPNAVLEACAMEIPVITTSALGCIDSVENEKTGLIVPMNDPEKLEAAMERLITNEELRKRLGKNARQNVLKMYAPENIAEFVFKEIVGQAPIL
jgi:glycosyltransferase involved in cell wall biosynthesis